MTQFIFMLTRDDVTVDDALDCYDEVRDLDLRWVGFKDQGLPIRDLRRLAERIRSDGRKVALEVVSLEERSETGSVEAALEIGVDLLMGGVHPDLVLPMLSRCNVMYFPFPGRVVGHPSVLEGTIDDIVASARKLSRRPGVHGLDLLAYRFAGDAPALLTAVVDQAFGPVVVAGSIDSPAKVLAVRRAGAWALTVGSAAFEASFPADPGLRGQVQHVLSLLSADPPIPSSD
jgi:hypothetical protein